MNYLVFIFRQCDGFSNQHVISRHSDARSNNAVIVQLAVVCIPHSYHHMRGVVVNTVVAINAVALHRARLLLGWVTSAGR